MEPSTNNQKDQQQSTINSITSKVSPINLRNCVLKLTNESIMFAKLLSPKSSKSRSGLTRRNNSNTKRKEDENGLDNVTQNCSNELVNRNTETVSSSVPVKLTHEPSPVGGTVCNNNNNKNVININNQRNQRHRHQPASLSSPESSSSSSLSSSDIRRRRGNDDASPDDQLIVDGNLILPSTYHDIGSNQSTNCDQVNDEQQQIDGDNQLDDNLNSNTMTVDSVNHNHLRSSSLVNEAYRSECIQLRQRVKELEQQNRLLTLLLAEQLLSSSTNSVDNQSKLDKLMAINNLTNHQPQFISEYTSTTLINDNEGEASIMNSSSSPPPPPGQGHITMNQGVKGISSESDYSRSMGNEDDDDQLSNNNNHHDDETECSDRQRVSMSECNSMLGVNLSHVNIDRWRRDDEPKTTTNTQSPSKPNAPTNQLTSKIVSSSTPTSTIRSTINSTNCEPINSFNSIDSRGKSIPINNLVTNNSILFTSTTSSSPTTIVNSINPLPSTVLSTSSSTFTTPTTTNTYSSSSRSIDPTLPATTTSTLSTLTSTLIGSPSSSLSLSPPPSPKKLISSTIIDSSLFQLPTTNLVNYSPSPSTNQLEKRILFILASNNTKCFNSTFSSSSSSSVSTDKINCDNRLINKPTNLALRTLSGSSSSLKDNNLSSSSTTKSIVSLEKDSPASSATSFDSNGELTSKDEGYSTMSSDVQSDTGGGNNNNGTPSIVTINPLTTTINIKNGPTINSIHNDDDCKDDGTTISKSFAILNPPPPPPPPPQRTSQPSPSSSSQSTTSSLSNLIHLKSHQQLKGETIEIKSEPKKMGVNGSPANSIPLTTMSTVNPIVVGSSRLTTFKSPNQMDCLVTSSSTINVKNNQLNSLCEEDADSLVGDKIKLNCNGPVGQTVSINQMQSVSKMVTIKSGVNNDLIDANKPLNWLKKSDGMNGQSQSIDTDNLIRKWRKNPVNRSTTHRYTFPPVNTRTNSFDGIEWTPCLIYQPSKSPFDHLHDDSLINANERKSIGPRLIETAEKSTSADFDDDKVDTKCSVNKLDDKRMRNHHYHLGKDEKVNDQQFDGKTDELDQVESESLGDWNTKMGGGRRKSSVTKGAASGSLAMKTTRDTVEDDEDEYDEEEEEEEGENEVKFCYKIDQKRKLKVHKLPPPGSSSSSHGSQTLNRWHSDSQLYSDSMKKEKPSTIMLQHAVQVGRTSCYHHHRSPRRRDITHSHPPSQSFASTCKRSSGYIRRRIKREDRARIDESHRWSTLSTSSSALSDALESPIYYERRRIRPRLPMTITTDTVGLGNIPKSTETRTGTSRLIRYISSDENHSADDEDSAERFVSYWLQKSGGGLRWDDSEVTWKLNESIDWPEPIELDNACLNHLSSSNSSPSSSAAISPPNDNQMASNMNTDDTFEEIPLIDDDSDESEKIEITATINNQKYSVLISSCDDEVDGNGCGGVDVSHEGGGEGYISSDQASSVPDDGLTPETHFNGDFYRLCSVGSRTSLQHPDDEMSLPPPSSSGPLSSLSISPPLTDVKEQDEEEENDNSVNCNDKGTKIVLRQLTASNDQDDDELLVITTTIESNNHHQIKLCESINHVNQQESSSFIKSSSIGSSEYTSVLDLTTINASQSSQSLSSSPDESVKFEQSIVGNETTTSTIKTGSYEESKSIDCNETSQKGCKQLINSINAVEQSINHKNDGHRMMVAEVNDDDCHIYEEINQIDSQLMSKSSAQPSGKVNHQPKPILIKSSSTNQTSSSPTRIPLPKQSNSLDAIKANNKDGFKLRFNYPTKSTIDSITTNNVNNLISKSFINQHQTKRLNNNMMKGGDGSSSSSSSIPSTSSIISPKHGNESKNMNRMMVEVKGRMERNNNQVNHNRSAANRKSNQSIPSLEEFERRLSEDKQMADKIREFYSIFEQSTQSVSSQPHLTTTTKATIPLSQVPPTIESTTATTATIPTSVKGVKSHRPRSAISADLMKGIKLGNNERFEDIKLKLNYPKLLRSKGSVGGSTGSGHANSVGNDSGKMTKEGHETSWVHVSGFNVGKVGESCPEKQQPPVLTSPSPSTINSTATTTSINHNHRNLMNSGKLSSDSCSSEDEFNLGHIRGNGNGGKKRSSFHQRLLALHRSRRQRKRASDGYMGMGFLPKIRASIVDRLDFYHRFGDKEQEALTSFNFLNELPPTVTTTTTHSKPSKSTSVSLSLNGSTDFVEEQKLLLRCYLNSFQPLTTSPSTQSLPPPQPIPPIPQPQPLPPPSSSSSSSFSLSPYKWPQSPVKSSSSSSRYQSPVGTNYILNHELTKRTVGGVS